MFNMYAVALLFVVLVKLASADYVHPTCCQDIKPVQKIDWDAYEGEWVDHHHSEDGAYECAKYIYEHRQPKPTGYILYTEGIDSSKNKFTLVSKMLFKESTDKRAPGNYMEYEPCNERQCGLGTYPDPLNIFVLSTDYKKYTVEYNCFCVGDVKRESIWVMFRKDVTETTELTNAWKKALADNGITTKVTNFRKNCN